MLTFFSSTHTHTCVYMQILFLYMCIWLVVFIIGHFILGNGKDVGSGALTLDFWKHPALELSPSLHMGHAQCLWMLSLEGGLSGSTNADFPLERHLSVLECSILLWGVAVSHSPGLSSWDRAVSLLTVGGHPGGEEFLSDLSILHTGVFETKEQLICLGSTSCASGLG